MKIKLTKGRFFKRLLLTVMKTFIFLMCTTVFSLSSVNLISQNAKITIDADKTVTVDEVFDIIRAQTNDYMFMYHTDLFKTLPKVQLKKGVIRMDKLINQSLAGGNLNVVLTENNTILIKEANTKQQQQVTGKVTDASGLPIPGVTVLIKGTGKGTATDFDGNYSITVPNPENVLVFSSLGFENQEITVGSQTVINVTLKEAVATLEEVTINAGYYKVKQREATGSISRVDAKVIGKQPITNPLLALQGRIPGVQIIQRSGFPGGEVTLQIRGQNSLRFDGNDPLYIIDGVPFSSKSMSSTITGGQIINNASPFSSINPSDIESIDVLKDSDATAIYGSRGANGVVLITTKKGIPGKSKFNINTYSGIGKVSSKMDLLNTQQYVEMRIEALTNDGLWPNPPSSYAPDLLEWDTTRFTDWQKVLVGGTSQSTSTNLSYSGGNSNTQFLISGGYYSESTVLPGDFQYRKISSHFNLNHISENKKFRITLSNSYLSDDNNLPQYDFMNTALFLPPNTPSIYDEEGEINWQNGTWVNPFGQMRQEYNAKTYNLITSVNLSYKITDNLTVKVPFGYNSIQRKEHALFPIISYYNPSGKQTGSSRFSDADIKTWNFEPQLDYFINIGKGRLEMLLGTTFMSRVSESIATVGFGYTSDALLSNIKSASNTFIFQVDKTEYRYQSIFGRANYNWDNRYIVNIVGRRDGSTRFGKNNHFGNFGSIGIGWVFSNENFLKNSLLSFGKIRTSYGTTGSDQIPDYGYLDSYSTTPYPYDGNSGLRPTRLANPDFAWETNRKFEIALELGFIENNLSLVTSYYRNRSSNQLVGYSLPTITGFSSIQYNLDATVQNTGLEIELNSNNLSTKDFGWSSSLNLTVPRDKLVSYPNIEGSSYASTYVVGEPLTRKVFHFTGVDPQTGIYTFEDVDGNGNGGDYPADLQASKKRVGQNFFGGLQNDFRYKNFELSTFIQFSSQTVNGFPYAWPAPGGGRANQPIEVLDRWQNPGDITNIQRFTVTGAAVSAFYEAGTSDYVIADASFIRLKNIELSWKMPSTLLNKIHLTEGRIYLQGQNLITISNYLGLNPETQTYAMPPLRTLIVGLQFSL